MFAIQTRLQALQVFFNTLSFIQLPFTSSVSSQRLFWIHCKTEHYMRFFLSTALSINKYFNETSIISVIAKLWEQYIIFNVPHRLPLRLLSKSFSPRLLLWCAQFLKCDRLNKHFIWNVNSQNTDYHCYF